MSRAASCSTHQAKPIHHPYLRVPVFLRPALTRVRLRQVPIFRGVCFLGHLLHLLVLVLLMLPIGLSRGGGIIIVLYSPPRKRLARSAGGCPLFHRRVRSSAVGLRLSPELVGLGVVVDHRRLKRAVGGMEPGGGSTIEERHGETE